MRGFTSILVLLLIIGGMAIGLYLVQQKTHLLSQALTNDPLGSLVAQDVKQEQTNTGAIPFPSPTPNKNSSAFLSVFDRLKARVTPTKTTTPTPSIIAPTTTPEPTATPTSSPTSTPTPTPPSTCGVNALAAPLNPEESFDNLLTLLLTYAASYKVNKYVVAAQWDFDGNGSWDTDMSLSNNQIPHTFPSYGNHTVKLRLKMSDGEITADCSKVVTVPMGIEVKVSGKVYSDDNCDDYKENSEAGMPDVPVTVYLEKTNTYGNLRTDTNGNYELTKIIDPSNYVLVQSTTESITGYTLHSSSRNQVQTYTLNNNQKQITVDLSQVPLDSVSMCQAY